MSLSRAKSQAIYFAVPGVKHYETEEYANNRFSFANISITGTECSCRCKHCGGKLLESMLPAFTLEEFREVIDNLAGKGCKGILVSGGADKNGEVPLLEFAPGMAYAKEKGLKVLAHSGIISRATAAALKRAGVDQVLMDIIGDESTIREIYHLKRQPADYYEAMINCRAVGLGFVPHIVAGLYYGRLQGEYQALEMIRQAKPRVLVLVVFTPVRGTAMEFECPAPVQEIGRLIQKARAALPDTVLTLGCAKPAGIYKEELEKLAVDSGVDVIAFPSESTINYCRLKGLNLIFKEECCSTCGE